jgi:hypothetical protein
VVADHTPALCDRLVAGYPDHEVVARNLGINVGILRNWMNADKRRSGNGGRCTEGG